MSKKRPLRKMKVSTGMKVRKPVLRDELRPIFVMLKILGLLPLYRDLSGNVHFKLMSFPTLYSVCLFVLSGSGVFYVLYNIMLASLLRSTAHGFSHVVFRYTALVLLSMHIILIPCHWFEGYKIAHTIRQWNKFQEDFLRVTGKNLEFGVKKKAIFHTISGPIWGLIIYLLTKRVEYRFTFSIHDIYLICVCVYVVTVLYLNIALCTLSFQCLINVGKSFLKSFSEDITSNIAIPELTEEYRKLWLCLSQITRHTGSSLCYIMSSMIIFWFIVMLTSLYGVSMAIIKLQINIRTAVTFMSFFTSFCFLNIICRKGHGVTVQIGDKLSECIGSCVWRVSEDVKEELMIFLCVMEANYPVMSLGGYFTVNRKLFSTIMKTIVTYLIVMLQFSIKDMFDNSALDITMG